MDVFFRSNLINVVLSLILVTYSSGAVSGLIGRDLNSSIDGFEAYYDDVLNITWLADVNYAQTSGYVTSNNFGWLSHSEAIDWVDQLSIGGYDNWRLPTTGISDPTSSSIGNASATGITEHGFNITNPASELSYMFYVNLENIGRYDINGNENGCGAGNGTPSCLVNIGPFVNFDNTSLFWYEEERNLSNQSSWVFSTYNGVQSWSSSRFGTAWAVADGDIAGDTIVEVPEPPTIALLAFGGLVLIGRKLLKFTKYY